MKLNVTKAGKYFIAIVVISVLIFFLTGGTAVGLKKLEDYRASSISEVGDFSNKDISATNMAALKKALSEKNSELKKQIKTLNGYKKKYPSNQVISQKLLQYEGYQDAMKSAEFMCPEHITSGTEQQTRKCPNCNGSGKRLFFWKCKKCNGEKYIYTTVSVTKACPNCGSSSYKAMIPASRLIQ